MFLIYFRFHWNEEKIESAATAAPNANGEKIVEFSLLLLRRFAIS